MISQKQNALYWRLWSQAKRVLLNGRETMTGDEETKRRHELHVRAIGHDKSHLDFTNRELDYVLAQFRMIVHPFGASKSSSSSSSSSTADGAHHRRIYFGLRGVMRKLRLSEEYVQAISRRMFLGLEINDLGTDELQKLLIALREHERRQAA